MSHNQPEAADPVVDLRVPRRRRESSAHPRLLAVIAVGVMVVAGERYVPRVNPGLR